MKECLDYIKKSGEEIKELNLKIQAEMEENKKLRQQITDLELKIQKQENELKTAWELSNRWWHEYDTLSTKYDNLEALTDAMSFAIGQITPELFDQIHEDIKSAKKQKYIWSDICDTFKRTRW